MGTFTFINHMDSWREGEASQMTILLHKPYLVKVSTKGGGVVKNTQKFDHVVYGWPLWRITKLVNRFVIKAFQRNRWSLLISRNDLDAISFTMIDLFSPAPGWSFKYICALPLKHTAGDTESPFWDGGLLGTRNAKNCRFFFLISMLRLELIEYESKWWCQNYNNINNLATI